MLRSAKLRTHVCWILLLGGAAAFGCGGSEKQTGEPSDGGATNGDSGVGGGATTGGSGGAALGGGPSAGGAAGSGGTLVLDAAGPGITCGEATCVEGSQMCCVGESDPWCDDYQCANAIARLECDDSADCPGEGCCFSNMFSSVRIATFCTSDCASIGYTQVCKEPGDCDNGETCHPFACGIEATGSFVLGLCTATAPEFCE